MRIPKAWVPLLAKKITENLVAKGLVKSASSIEELVMATEELILEELSIEDRVNEEVRQLLKGYTSEIEKGRLDYRRLFEMTKQKLVRERNLVL
jgi:hypothetical protein